MVCERNRDENKLMLACEDGTVVSEPLNCRINCSTFNLCEGVSPSSDSPGSVHSGKDSHHTDLHSELRREHLPLLPHSAGILLCLPRQSSPHSFLPQKPIFLIRWHPASSFAFVLSSRGELQAYDLGLNPLMFLVNAEEPSPTPILRLDSHIL